MAAGRTYVIYYGWLADDARGAPNAAAREIAAAAPPLLIAHFRTAPPARHRNLSAAVLSAFRDVGTEVFAYLATGYGSANPEALAPAIEEYLEAGASGIFFDEVDPLVTGTQLARYAALAARVRRRGGQVILNTGVAACGERIMECADRLMVEHRWRSFTRASLWSHRYAPERFMGVSSEEESAMGYRIDLDTAIRDTREAWACGVGWHTSTTRYVELPPWFGAYLAAVSG